MAIVAVRGEHETFSAPRLAADLEGLLGDGLAIVVDLTEADFLDSTVVSVLLRARFDARERDSKLAIVVDDSTGWAVRRLFQVTGLDEIFEIAGDREKAIAAVRSA